MLGFNAISEVSIAELPGAFVPIDGLSSTSAVGSVTAEGIGTIDVTGLVGTTALGELANVTGAANITLDGISATLSVTSVIVWGKIIPAPGTSYTAITPSSSPTWSEKTTGVSQTWTEVA